MLLRHLLVFSLFIGSYYCQLEAQIGIPTFNRGGFSMKQLLSDARQKDQNILIISYSSKATTEVLPSIKHPDSILALYPMVTDVIDPFMEMGDLITYRLKQYSNPGWIIIHPENRILSYSNKIRSDADLKSFTATAYAIKKEYDTSLSVLDKDKNDINGLKSTISVMSKMYENRGINKYINRLLKLIQGKELKELPLLINIASKSPGNNNLNKLIIKNKDAVIRASSAKQYMDIRQKAIIKDLKNRGLYEPYMIWKKFEGEFEMQADSLYRLQAIMYFASDPETKEELLEELIGYLDLYPDTPWEILDPMYYRALQHITTKEDLNIMLDLIGGQLFQEKNYRKLDYRAYILYRLGQKERSLRMIQEVMSLAKKEDASYKSMIYSINKK